MISLCRSQSVGFSSLLALLSVIVTLIAVWLHSTLLAVSNSLVDIDDQHAFFQQASCLRHGLSAVESCLRPDLLLPRWPDYFERHTL
jgi:hypothetical protein